MKPETTERAKRRRQLLMYLCGNSPRRSGQRACAGARRCCKKHLRRAIRRAVRLYIRNALSSE